MPQHDARNRPAGIIAVHSESPSASPHCTPERGLRAPRRGHPRQPAAPHRQGHGLREHHATYVRRVRRAGHRAGPSARRRDHRQERPPHPERPQRHCVHDFLRRNVCGLQHDLVRPAKVRGADTIRSAEDVHSGVPRRVGVRPEHRHVQRHGHGSETRRAAARPNHHRRQRHRAGPALPRPHHGRDRALADRLRNVGPARHRPRTALWRRLQPELHVPRLGKRSKQHRPPEAQGARGRVADVRNPALLGAVRVVWLRPRSCRAWSLLVHCLLDHAGVDDGQRARADAGPHCEDHRLCRQRRARDDDRSDLPALRDPDRGGEEA
eukprot:PhM_4_TR3073/c0_g2_i1/m.102585